MNAITEHNWPGLVTASPLPVLVVFHSPFSAYARRSLALLRKLEPDFPALRFGCVNVDTEDELTRQHGIQGIPAFVIYRGGTRVAFFMGERSEKRLRETIAKAVVP